MSVVIDGMDQKKTNLPHFVNVPKDLPEADFLRLHLVGALIFNGVVDCRVYLTYPNIHGDPNLTVTILNKILLAKEKLPPVLYVQLDNTTRENKNQVFFAYCAMLVELGIFRKVKVGFLLVGHTHDQIDQMFSRFSVRLRRKKAFCLDSMLEVIEQAYNPEPVIEVLAETIDFREFVFQKQSTSGPAIHQLNNLTFQHHVKFKIRNGKACLQGKYFVTSKSWLPEPGLEYLKFIPDVTEMKRAL